MTFDPLIATAYSVVGTELHTCTMQGLWNGPMSGEEGLNGKFGFFKLQ